MRRAAMLLIAACALCACSRPSSIASSSVGAEGEPLPAPPRVVADRLLGGDFVAPSGYTILQRLACEAPAHGEALTIRCRALLNDQERRGQPAIVDIQLYDHDVTFAAEDAPVSAHIDALHGEDTITDNPSFTKTTKSGHKVKLDTACHQARGRQNSPAYCTIMPNSRVMVITGVRPLHAASHGMTVSIVNGVQHNTAAEDTDHASELSLQILGVINSYQ
jgi:hypothetical protein